MKKVICFGLFSAALLCAELAGAAGERDVPKGQHAAVAEAKVIKKQAKGAKAPSIRSSFPRKAPDAPAKTDLKGDAKR
jgi:hypothetical protein